jgi:hypothetical protein
MNRRERRRENIHTKTQAMNMTRDQLISMQMEAHQDGVIEGKKAGIRVAVETCMGAYTIVLESNGLFPTTVQEIFRQANDEVFNQLADKQLDLSDIPMFAKRCGVDVTA